MSSSSDRLNDFTIARLYRMGATDIQHDIANRFAQNQRGVPNVRARFGATPIFVKIAYDSDFVSAQLEQDWQALYQTSQLADGLFIIVATASVTEQAAVLFSKVCGNCLDAEFWGGVA